VTTPFQLDSIGEKAKRDLGIFGIASYRYGVLFVVVNRRHLIDTFLPHPSFLLPPHNQTTIDVEFKPISSISSYELQWKPIEQPWSATMGSAPVQGSGSKAKAQAHTLEPGRTYCVRLACVVDGSTGEPGPELIIDTEQVGCTPKQSSGCACVIQ
jgi:hypothetical protein